MCLGTLIPNLPTGVPKRRSSFPNTRVRPDRAVSGRLLISTEAEPSKRKKAICRETKEICGDTKRFELPGQARLWITQLQGVFQMNVIFGKSIA
jgi:hypothetical protein